MPALAGRKSAQDQGEADRPRLWVEAQCMELEGPLPDTAATVNPRSKVLMFIAAPWTARRDRRFVARRVGRSGPA